MSRNVHEYAARHLKATALLSTLGELPDFPGRDELASWPAESWDLLALMAGVKRPSLETQRVVIEMATSRSLKRAS